MQPETKRPEDIDMRHFVDVIAEAMEGHCELAGEAGPDEQFEAAVELLANLGQANMSVLPTDYVLSLQEAAAAPASVGGGWVPVSERLPEPNTSVWAFMQFPGGRKTVVQAFFRLDGYWDEFMPECLTHWQPRYVPQPAAPVAPAGTQTHA